MDVKNFTVKQLLIAVGLAKGISRAEIGRVVECSQSYITKNIKNDEFNNLLEMFKLLQYDKDTAGYNNNVGKLLMESGRILYSEGNKING